MKEAQEKNEPSKKTVDAKWDDAINDIRRAAERQYRTRPLKTQCDACAELAERREARLHERRRLRRRLNDLHRNDEATLSSTVQLRRGNKVEHF